MSTLEDLPSVLVVHICSFFGTAIPVQSVVSLELTSKHFLRILRDPSLTHALYADYIKISADPHQALEDCMLTSLVQCIHPRQLFQRLVSPSCIECKQKTSHIWLGGLGCRMCESCVGRVVGLPSQLVDTCFEILLQDGAQYMQRATQTPMGSENNSSSEDEDVKSSLQIPRQLHIQGDEWNRQFSPIQDGRLTAPNTPVSTSSASLPYSPAPPLHQSPDALVSSTTSDDSITTQSSDGFNNLSRNPFIKLMSKEWMSLTDAWLFFALEPEHLRQLLCLNVEITFPNTRKVMVTTTCFHSKEIFENEWHAHISRKTKPNKHGLSMSDKKRINASSNDRLQLLNQHFHSVSHYLVPMHQAKNFADQLHGSLEQRAIARHKIITDLRQTYPDGACTECLLLAFVRGGTISQKNHGSECGWNQAIQSWPKILSRLAPEACMYALPPIKACGFVQVVNSYFFNPSTRPDIIVDPQLGEAQDFGIPYSPTPTTPPHWADQIANKDKIVSGTNYISDEAVDRVLLETYSSNDSVIAFPSSRYRMSEELTLQAVPQKLQKQPQKVATLEEAVYMAREGDCIIIANDIKYDENADRDEDDILLIVDKPLRIVGMKNYGSESKLERKERQKQVHLHNHHNACVLVEAPCMLEHLQISSGDAALYPIIRRQLPLRRDFDPNDQSNEVPYIPPEHLQEPYVLNMLGDEEIELDEEDEEVAVNYFSAIWARDDLFLHDCNVTAKQGSNIVIEDGGTIISQSSLCHSPLCGVALKNSGRLISMRDTLLLNNRGGPSTFKFPQQVLDSNYVVH